MDTQTQSSGSGAAVAVGDTRLAASERCDPMPPGCAVQSSLAIWLRGVVCLACVCLFREIAANMQARGCAAPVRTRIQMGRAASRVTCRAAAVAVKSVSGRMAELKAQGK